MDGKYFTCEVHNQKFQTFNDLKQHVLRYHKIHSKEKSTQLKCQQCVKFFKCESEFKLHKQHHEQNQRNYKNDPHLTKSNRKIPNEFKEFSEIPKNKNQEAAVISTYIKKEKHALLYQCHICSGSFYGESKLNEHLQSHLEDSALLNPSTAETQTKKSENLLLKSENDDELEFKPEITEKEHLENRKNSFIFSCQTCHRCFRLRKALNEHLKTHLAEKSSEFSCHPFQQTFNIEISRKNHISKYYSESIDFSCNDDEDYVPQNYSEDDNHNECEDIVNTIAASSMTADNFKSCNVSNFSGISHTLKKKEKPSGRIQTFKTQPLNIHRFRHHCYFCPIVCKSFHDLVRHTVGHTKEKGFECKICRKSYFRVSELNRHLTKNHKEIKPYKCKICQTKFHEHKILITHMLTHSHHCYQCNKTFSSLSDFKRHMNTTHSTKSPFKCRSCSTIFKRKDSCNAHERRYKH